MEQQPRPSPLSGFSPIQLFVGGIVSGILALCTIGFFVLLRMYLNGGFPSGGNAGNGQGVVNQEADAGALPSNPQEIRLRAVDKTDHIRGAKDPKVTIVEFSDFECPFCKVFHNTMIQLIAKYPNDVAWVYRQLPLDQLHSQARREAHATECAGEQGKFWELADIIFQETPSNDGLDLTKLPEYAKQAGLNASKFTSCMESNKYATAIQEDEQDGQAAGARGTPYSVIVGPNGETIPLSGAQPYSAVEAAIKQFLN